MAACWLVQVPLASVFRCDGAHNITEIVRGKMIKDPILGLQNRALTCIFTVGLTGFEPATP